MRNYAIRIACIAAILTAVGVSPLQAKDWGKIMPLGDSITLGLPISGGYRASLYNSLTIAGDALTFVGSNTDNSTTVLTAANQDHHEGHGGYIINGSVTGAPRTGLDENLAAWIGPGGASPDTILLMIGTNDLGTNYDIPNAPARLNDLIGDIYSYRPNVSLYVASLTPRSDIETAVETFNAALPAIVSARRSEGKNVYYVNMHDALTTSDLMDGLHPNAGGYNKMAQVWYNALMVPEPSSFVLLITGLLTLLACAWRYKSVG